MHQTHRRTCTETSSNPVPLPMSSPWTMREEMLPEGGKSPQSLMNLSAAFNWCPSRGPLVPGSWWNKKTWFHQVIAHTSMNPNPHAQRSQGFSVNGAAVTRLHDAHVVTPRCQSQDPAYETPEIQLKGASGSGSGSGPQLQCSEAQVGPAPCGLTPCGSSRNSRAVPSHQPGQAPLRRLPAAGPGSDGSTWGCEARLYRARGHPTRARSTWGGTACPTLPAKREGGRQALRAGGMCVGKNNGYLPRGVIRPSSFRLMVYAT